MLFFHMASLILCLFPLPPGVHTRQGIRVLCSTRGTQLVPRYYNQYGSVGMPTKAESEELTFDNARGALG